MLKKPNFNKLSDSLPVNPFPAPQIQKMTQEAKPVDISSALPIIQIPVPAPQIPAPMVNTQTSLPEPTFKFPAPQIREVPQQIAAPVKDISMFPAPQVKEQPIVAEQAKDLSMFPAPQIKPQTATAPYREAIENAQPENFQFPAPQIPAPQIPVVSDEVIQPVQTIANSSNFPAPLTPAEQKRLAYEKIKGEEVKNNDRGVKGFLKQFGGNFMRGIGRTAQANPNANLAQMIGGGLGQGTAGSIDNTMDEKAYKQQREAEALREYQIAQKMDENKIAGADKIAQTENTKLKPYFEQQKIDLKQKEIENKVLRDDRNFTQKITELERKAALEGGKWDVFTDEESGHVFKRFKNDPNRPLEPMMDPSKPNEQLTMPSKKVYEYTSPSGKILQVRGSEVLRTDVGLAQANATKTQSADTLNAKSLADYNAQVAELTGKITAAETRSQSARADIARIDGLTGIEKLKSTEKREALEKEIREADSERKGYSDQLKKLSKPTLIQAATVNTGKPVPPNKDPMGLFR